MAAALSQEGYPGTELILQSDAPQAYLQASFLGPGCVDTWMTMPREWIPDWVLKKYRSPCFKLYKAIYGHPLSGNLWGGTLLAVAKKEGLFSIPGHPSTLILPEGTARPVVELVRQRDAGARDKGGQGEYISPGVDRQRSMSAHISAVWLDACLRRFLRFWWCMLMICFSAGHGHRRFSNVSARALNWMSPSSSASFWGFIII
eukprot:2454935-Amphidinium_carterae.1